MADDNTDDKEIKDGTPVDETPPDEELSYQEKLKQELLQLQKMQATSIYPPKDQSQAPQEPVKPQDSITTDKLTIDPETPNLPQPDYTDKPDAKIRMLTTQSTPGKTFSPVVERAIEQASKLHNVDPNLLRGFVSVESGGDPNANRDNPGRQYKGLMQIGRTEWNTHGQGGDIYNPDANMMGGASLTQRNRQDFIRAMGREPTPAELYLVHQQGLGFFTNGTMTNIRGNLPAEAQTPENMTREGYERWWTNRINRAIKERGSAPTMRKVEDSNLPKGFLYAGPFADVGGEPLTKGGTADTPEAQAMIAELMRGKPLAQQAGTAGAAAEAAAERSSKYQPQTLPKVGTSRERQQAQGNLPVSVNQTDTLPIPGITQTPGERAYDDATNPSVMSTIMQEMQKRKDALPVVPAASKEPVPELSFLDKLKAVISTINSVAPYNWTAEGVKTAVDAAPQITKNAMDAVGTSAVQIPQGVISGLMSQPAQVFGGGTAAAIAAGGLLTGSQNAQQKALELQNEVEDWTKNRQQNVGIDPANIQPAQQAGQTIGENVGPGLIRTAKNLGFQYLANKTIIPGAEYMAQNYPIPNLNPVGTAEAATAFGRPPLIVQTPGGPVVANDATVQGLAWGGIFTLGIGASPNAVSRTIRIVKEMKPYGWTGMSDIFDPRRIVEGTQSSPNGPAWAASIASDKLKGGIVDNYQMMLDIADRQARYDKGKSVGIDPYAADAAKWKWRVQTGSGAQNLVNRAIVEGKVTTDDFRFDVPVPIAKLHEFAEANPMFPEYLKMRMVIEHLTNNALARQKLPATNKNPVGKFPDSVEDSFGRTLNLMDAQNRAHRLETDYPDFVTQHANYQNNLAATRDFVSDKNTNWVEHPIALNAQAIKMPTAPIFSHRADPKGFLDMVLTGQNPLSVAETAMRKAMANQMKFDAEQHYINNVASRDAFVPVSAEWVKNQGAKAAANGAILTRKMGGETTHWVADPLLVSMMNADHVPVTGLGGWALTSKNLFQSTTTGLFAPWFAPTGGVRAMEQGWTNAPSGVKDAQGRTRVAAGPFATLAAIPAQIVPRALDKMAPTVAWFENRIQNSNLGQLIDPAHHNIMSRAMEKAYQDSFYKRMLDAGAYSGTTLQQDRVIHSNVTQAMLNNPNPQMGPIFNLMNSSFGSWMKFAWGGVESAGRGVKNLGKATNESLRAVQEAPNFAWAYKVGKTADDIQRPTINGRAMSDAELAARMRNYTGDPSTRGFIYSENQQTGKQETLRYQPKNKFDEMRADAYTAVGQFAHGARMSTPWAGVLIQSPASTLKAMRDNPIRANLAFGISHVLPETAAYFWNMHQTEEDKERAQQEGRPPYDYLDYYLHQRTENNLMNNTYFAPTDGKRPEEGVEFRHYQEGILQRYMTRAWWQQYFGINMHNMKEDLAAATWGFLGGAVIPPQPSWYNALLGTQGAVSPQGWLGGIQKRRINQYITLGGGESPLELTARAIIPSLSDLGIQAYTAGKSAPTWGEVPKAAASAVGTRILERTFGVGDVLGFKPQRAGSSEVTDELWQRKHIIGDLLYRWNVWDTGGGKVKQKPASIEGGKYTAPFLPDKQPADGDYVPNAGQNQPEPKNPLYKMMMGELKKTFETDVPSKGGLGWKTMWKSYMEYGSLVARMKTVNRGDEGQWLADHNNPNNKDALGKTPEFLRAHGVDPTNFRQVRDFYAANHYAVANTMMKTIRATEQRIDAMPQIREMLKDRHFTMDMLDPNELGIRNPEDYEEHEKSAN